MIHEVPDPQPLKSEVTIQLLREAKEGNWAADVIRTMTMEDYAKVRHMLVGPAMVEWKTHYLKTGSIT